MTKARTNTSLPILRNEMTLAAAAVALVRTIALWRLRLHSRHELSQLTPEQMRDVGLDPARVRREAAKPFWQA